MEKPKNIVLLTSAVVLVVGLGYWFSYQGWSFNWLFQPFDSVIQSQLSNNIQDAPFGQLPSGMPQDIVLAKDAEILHGYTAGKDDKKESTLIYNTAESADKLTAQYINYLTNSGWSINEKPTTAASTKTSVAGKVIMVPVSLLISATKDSMRLSVKISENLAGGGKLLVTVSLLGNQP